MSVARLMSWEADEALPTIRQARALSRIYRRPLAVFYLSAPPTDLGLSVPRDFRRLPEKSRERLTSELATELRRIEHLRDSALGLAVEVPNEPVQFVASFNLANDSLIVATKASDFLGITMNDRNEWRDAAHYDGLNGWKQAIERLGVLVIQLKGVEVA